MAQREFDVVVIGGGAAGENAADYAVRSGLSAALVEERLVGGECSYWACVPSKALLRTPQAVAAARRLPGGTAQLEPVAVLPRRTAFTDDWDDSSQVTWADDAGITVVRGHGRIAGTRLVEVSTTGRTQLLRARHAVVVCTGSAPYLPPVPGLAAVHVWTSREATATREIPRRLGVLGGGVVGCEMAQAFQRLGSRVVLLSRGPRLLPAMEPFAGQRVATALRADGVDVRLGTGLDAVTKLEDDDVSGASGAETVALHVGSETLIVDELLVATGRRPRTADVGLDTIGLDPGDALRVDDTGQVVGVPGGWLYAAGDVTGRALLTHQGKYQARIVGAVIGARARGEELDVRPWGRHVTTADHRAVPQVVFTDPEVASVGWTERQAREAGVDVRVVDLPIAVAGAQLLADGYEGAVRIVVDRERDVPVGMTFVGQDVAELLHAATIAVTGEVPLSRLWHAVPAFPTMSEVWLRLLEAYRRS